MRELRYDETGPLEEAARIAIAKDGSSSLEPLREIIAKIDGRRFAEDTDRMRSNVFAQIQRRFLELVKERGEQEDPDAEPSDHCKEGTSSQYSRGCSRKGKDVVPDRVEGGLVKRGAYCFQHAPKKLAGSRDRLLTDAIEDTMDVSSTSYPESVLRNSDLATLVAFAKAWKTEIPERWADALRARGVEP